MKIWGVKYEKFICSFYKEKGYIVEHIGVKNDELTDEKIVQAVEEDTEEEHTVTKIVGNKIFNVDYNEQVIYQQELVL